MVRVAVHSLVWRYWVPPVGWALFLMVVSGDFGASPTTYGPLKWVLATFFNLAPKTIDFLHPWFRKSLHVICYGILAVLWFRSLMITFPERLRINLILALLLSLGVALVDEGHQFLLTSRTGTLRDVGLDMVGAVLFTLIAARCWKRKVTVPFEGQPLFPDASPSPSACNGKKGDLSSQGRNWPYERPEKSER
jgi:VanZ family protein